MPIDYPALATEINTDPRSYGYAAHVAAGNDQAVAGLLNLARDGTNGGPAVVIRRADIASREIMEAIRITDYTALPANPNTSALSQERRALSWLESLVNADRVRLLNDDGTNNPVMSNFADMFPAGTGTRDRLVALAQRHGSRAEELFGRDAAVTADDVAKALRPNG